MPIDRIKRVASSTALNFPGVTPNAVPFAWDETNEQFICKTTAGVVKRIPLTDSGSAGAAFALQPNIDETNLIQYDYGTITNAQIKDLADTPVQLVGAAPAGHFIELISLQLILDYSGGALAEPSTPDNLQVRYENEAGAVATAEIVAAGFIDQTADTIIGVLGTGIPAGAATAVEGKALVLCNMGGDYTGAGSTSIIKFKAVWRLHPTGL